MGRIAVQPTETRMFREAAEAAGRLRVHRDGAAARARAAAEALKRFDPAFVATVARGSSDHAATFAKYLIETRVRLPTLSYAPSISSLYEATSDKLARAAFFFLSQSGRSPDLLKSAEAAGEAGALRIGLLNDVATPLAEAVDLVIPVFAGRELSVAATKSFIATLAALVALVAEWTDDAALREAWEALPEGLEAAWSQDWSQAVAPLAQGPNLFVLGRGLTLGIAHEAALKLKETSGLHAEAFSIAEVAHGPMALAGKGFPVLIFPPQDAASEGLSELIAALSDRGAVTLVAGEGFGGDVILPLPPGLHPATAPIAAIQRFYRLANEVALARGFDPDRPPFLSKVTETL